MLAEAGRSVPCSILAKHKRGHERRQKKKERRSQRNVNLDVSERIKCPKSTANSQFNIKAGDKERDHLTDVSLSGLY